MRKLKFLLTLFLLAALSLGLYIFFIISDVDEIFTAHHSGNPPLVKMEIGSQTNKKQFQDFYKFSTSEKIFDQWMSENLENKNIKLTNGKIEFLSDVEINGLYVNHCGRIYCFQNKTQFSNIPPSLWKALIGTEDIRFLDHRGVDLKSILRALWVDLKKMKYVQGGSTITQQLVKNLFLSNEKSIERKIKEVIMALYIEYRYKKEEILQAYLNEQVWGSLNGIRIKGHQAASLFYFNKPSQKLSEVEAAILISMLKGPYYYSPLTHVERLISRSNTQFNKLVENDLFYSKKSDFWKKKKWLAWSNKLTVRVKSNIYKDFYLSSKERGNKNTNRYEIFTWFRGISEVRNILKSRTDNKDFAFKIFRKNLTCQKCIPFKIYSKIEKNLRKAIDSERHQIGSIFKPLVYQNFLDEGYTRNHLISTEEISFNLKSGIWTPNDSKTIEKELKLEVALQKSKNRPFIRLSSEYGFEHIQTYLQRLNIPNLKLPLSEYPAQLLGAIELSVNEVGSIYTQFIDNLCERINRDILKWEDSVFDILSDPKKNYHIKNC